MLRSILTTFQNQKSKIVLWFLVFFTMILFIVIAIKYIWSYNNIIATTSATKSANILLQTIIEGYNSSHSWSKLRIYEINTLDEITSLNSKALVQSDRDR
jgi:alpha-N-acetylglucosamine transferase